MKQQFKQKVDTGNLTGTRISLSNEMMLDPRGESFKEMKAYAETALPNLYEPHDGGALDKNHDNWTKELLFATKNDLDDNFSKERLEYYYELAKSVLREKADSLDEKERKSNSRSYEKGTTKNTPSPLYLGLAVGGLLVGGTGLLVGRIVVAAAGLAAATIGGSMLYKNQSNK